MRAVIALFLTVAALFGQQGKADARWTPLEFLIGEWVGEGGGAPGQGSGGFSLLPDQDGKILVRKNRADYPATKEKPAYSHTDLMIVYQEPASTKLRAVYFDSEDHMIHYSVEPSADGNSVQFVSEASALQERYRLTYRKSGADRVAIQFEIAPADNPSAFSTYIEAAARRKENLVLK